MDIYKFHQYSDIKNNYNFKWRTALKKPAFRDVYEIQEGSVAVNSPEGWVKGNAGDLIIVDADGNFYIHYKETFWGLYDEIGHNYQSRYPRKLRYFRAYRKPVRVEFAVIDKDFEIVQKSDIQYGNAGDIIIKTPHSNHFYRIYPSIFKKTYILKPEYQVYLGRFSPVHHGHTRMIEQMLLDFGYEKSLLLIGSCSSKLGKRLFYTYSQRREMIKKLYPKITLCGLPDYKDVDDDPEFKQWHQNLWDIIRLRFPEADEYNTSFLIGTEEDAYFFKNYLTEIIERHDDNGLNISATEVRNRLILDFNDISVSNSPFDASSSPRHLVELCDSEIIPQITKYYQENKKRIFEC